MSDEERWMVTVIIGSWLFAIAILWFDSRLDYLEALANGAIWGTR